MYMLLRAIQYQVDKGPMERSDRQGKTDPEHVAFCGRMWEFRPWR